MDNITEKNLKEAFLSECEAYTRYIIYSAKAQEDGLEVISELFSDIAGNELEHADIWLKYLGENQTTIQNLMECLSAEKYAYGDRYKRMEIQARQEGNEELAKKFELTAKVEYSHAEILSDYLKRLKDGTLFKRNRETVWRCLKCGNIVKGYSAPEYCPLCHHSQGNFIALNTCE